MVLNLEIQSANQPGNQPVMGCEICRGIHLMNCPFVFNLIRIQIGHGESGMFNSMGQLENYADQQTSHDGGNQKSNQPGTKAHHVNRKSNKNEGMYYFKNPEVEMIHK